MRTWSAPDHLENEGLAGRILEGVVQAEHDREDAHLPETHHMGDRQHAQHQRLDSHERLQHDHQLPLVDAVGDDAGVRPEEEHGQGLQGDARRRAPCAECVRVNTSHDWATDCIHVPTREMDWPTKKRRKFGTDSAENVRRPMANSLLTG